MIKSNISPLGKKVFVTELERGERKTQSGFFISDDTGKDYGIRDRWAKVYAVGPEVYDLKKGDWILVEHGRWTVGIDIQFENGEDGKVWMVDYPDAVSIVSDEFPHDYIFDNSKK